MLMLMFRLVSVVASLSARRATARTNAIQERAEKAQDELRKTETEVENSGSKNLGAAISLASRLPALKADADKLLAEWEKRSERAERLNARAARLADAKGRWVPYLVGKAEAVAVALAVVWLPTVVDVSDLLRQVIGLVQPEAVAAE